MLSKYHVPIVKNRCFVKPTPVFPLVLILDKSHSARSLPMEAAWSFEYLISTSLLIFISLCK